MKMAEYMIDKVGQEFEGIISSVTSFGMFVEVEKAIEIAEFIDIPHHVKEIKIHSLNDLNDVSVPTPAVDNVLTWNGAEWVDAAVGAKSAGSVVNYYYVNPIINTITIPAGLSQDGTIGNGIQVATFSRTPVTTGGTVVVAGLSGTDTRAFVAWESPNPIQRTQ